MREILFRGKRVDNGKRVEGYLVCTKNEEAYIIDTPSDFGYGDNGNRIRIGCFKKVDFATVGQYTGLQDKNRNKIFEGDIIKCDCWCVGKEHGNFSNFEVKFLDDGFCAGRNPLGSWLFNSINGNTELRDVEIIGNIHDNPELLKVE